VSTFTNELETISLRNETDILMHIVPAREDKAQQKGRETREEEEKKEECNTINFFIKIHNTGNKIVDV
jgi:hypothetical protein